MVHAGSIAAWAAAPRTTRGGQPSYSDLAIATALTLRAVFRLALLQTEGLIGSILSRVGASGKPGTVQAAIGGSVAGSASIDGGVSSAIPSICI